MIVRTHGYGLDKHCSGPSSKGIPYGSNYHVAGNSAYDDLFAVSSPKATIGSILNVDNVSGIHRFQAPAKTKRVTFSSDLRSNQKEV